MNFLRIEVTFSKDVILFKEDCVKFIVRILSLLFFKVIDYERVWYDVEDRSLSFF